MTQRVEFPQRIDEAVYVLKLPNRDVESAHRERVE